MYRNRGGFMPDIQNCCVFCDIVAGKAPAYIIHEDELSICILDIQPFAKGHCLVISKRHVPWWYELTEQETESLFRTARIVSQKIMKEYQPDFVCMYARGKRIPHTHIFLIPSYNGDVLDRFFNTLEGVQEKSVELAKLRDKNILTEVARTLTIQD
jgi:histidine triad (HIT) family protein